MAALEKIRKRAAILTIVIGAALLAFILEEGVRAMGSMGNDTTALIVGDEKVDYSEYKQLLDSSPRNQEQKIDDNVVKKDIIERFVEDKLLSQECEEANLLVSEEEIANLLQTPEGAPREVLQAGLDPKVAFEQLKNADPNDKNAQALIAIYDEQTKNLTKGLKMFKLDVAVRGSMQPNNIDLALMKEESTTYTVEYASVRYDDYPEKVTVSDEEIKKAYEQFKEAFKLDQEKRRISYILVPKEPSQKDIDLANVEIAKILKDFEAYDGISGIRKNKNPHLFIDSIVKSKKAGNDTIINALIAAGKSSLVKRQDPKGPNDHTTILYKVTNVTACPATVALDQVAVAGPKAKQDSIIPFLKSGISTDSIAKLFSKDRNVEITPFAKHNQKITGEQLVNDKSACDSVNKYLNSGQFFVIQEVKDVDQPYTIYAKVVEGKDSIVNYYTIARAKYVNKPSDLTETALKDKLQSFVDKNNTAADFSKNAAKEKYIVKTAIIDASTAMIGEQIQINPMTGQPQRVNGVPKSREAIKWAFDSKPGAVSTEKIFEGEDYFMVVALEAVYEDYVPYNDPGLKMELTNYVRNEKIGELLKNKCKGKNNIEDLAKTLNTTVQTLDITPGARSIDPKVAGRISGLGDKSLNTIQVIAGDNAFYVVKVISKKENPRNLPKQQLLSEFWTNNYNLSSLLHNSRKVVNNTLKFE